MYRTINRIALVVSALVAVIAISAYLPAALGGSVAPGNPAESAASCPVAFKADGSTTVFPIARDSEGPFESFWGPGTDVQVSSIGSGAGITNLINGSAEAAQSSRPLTANEAVGKYVFKIALDAHVIAVKGDGSMNFLAGGITRAQLATIYSAGGAITTLKWSDLNGAWPANPIIPRARITASGSQPDFLSQIGVSLAAEDATIAATGLPRLTESSDMAAAAAANTNQIVYTSLAQIASHPGMLVIPVSNGGPFVPPNDTTVLNGTYPLPRQLFVAVRDKATNNRFDNTNFVRADDWVNWLRSPAAISLIDSEGFIPVPAESKPPIPDWDIDLNGTTSLTDLGGVAAKWGQESNCKGWIRADANNSTEVSLGDIGVVTNKWGTSGFHCAIAPANPCPED